MANSDFCRSRLPMTVEAAGWSYNFVERRTASGCRWLGRIACFLKADKYADHVGAGAPVYLIVVLEYLAAEVLELAGNTARDNKKTRIIPRHIHLAVPNNEDLNMHEWWQCCWWRH
ncbi:Protein H2A.7 [Asimina triloba]